MNIDEKLKILFKERAPYYKKFLDRLTNIDYILLNLYDYGIDKDKVSGDLDIIIDSNDYDKLTNILKYEGFFPYIKSNTNQIQWIKYINSIGTIQVHVHLDLYYFNTRIIKFVQLQHTNHLLDANEEYILFCLQTFYKNKYNHRIYKKYTFFQNKINFIQVQNLLETKYSKTKNFFLNARNSIIERKQLSKYIFYKNLMQNNFFPTINYLFTKIYLKINKLLNAKTNDIEIIFMGVDGAGKSTTIENVKAVFNNEILYKSHYFGLKTSLINRIRSLFVRKNKVIKDKSTSKNENDSKKISTLKKIYFTIIGVLYWIEYNIKYFFSVKCNAIIAPTVHLIDRSYYDALLYYDIKLLDVLFLKYSFKPNLIIYLTGDTNMLYERKMEISKKEIEINKTKYNILINKIKQYNKFELEVIDSTIKTEEEIKNIVSMNLFQLIAKEV